MALSINPNWAVVVPMANEEPDFAEFAVAVKSVLDELNSGTFFFVVDHVSTDRTLELCKNISDSDKRFVTIWAPENCNVVDAYLRGYREAWKAGFEFIIEMDAGLSHDPKSLPFFLEKLGEGYECVFGSRFIEGGSMNDSPFKRKMLSRVGTILANVLLGTKLHDMTSGYQGFHRDVVEKFLNYKLHSKAHFYQTEMRYLLRKRRSIEIPVQYRAPSPRVSKGAIKNSLETLAYYFFRRITFHGVAL